MGVTKRSYVRLIESCISQLKAQGLSWKCNESKEEGEASVGFLDPKVAQVSQSKRLLVDALHEQHLCVDANKTMVLCGCAMDVLLMHLCPVVRGCNQMRVMSSKRQTHVNVFETTVAQILDTNACLWMLSNRTFFVGVKNARPRSGLQRNCLNDPDVNNPQNHWLAIPWVHRGVPTDKVTERWSRSTVE